MVEWNHAAHEIPWRPRRCWLIVVDEANVELQWRLRHDRNVLYAISDEPQRWEQTGGAAASMLEAWPGQSCHSRVLTSDTTRERKQSSVTYWQRWQSWRSAAKQHNTVRQTWGAAPRSLSINTPRSRTALSGLTSAPATDKEQLDSCDSLLVDEHHITSVLSALSWRWFEHILLEMLSTHCDTVFDNDSSIWLTGAGAVYVAVISILM